MKKINFESVLRKTLATAYVFGVCGGMYISGMRNFSSGKSTFALLIQLIILIISSSLLAAAARTRKLRRIKESSQTDDEVELKISEQKSFFIVLAIMIIAHFLNSDMNEWNQFSAMMLTAGVFLLGMINGHIDISTYAPKYLLSLGIIPVLISFVLGYSVFSNNEVINLVWIFGFLAFLSFLLILSNSQLNAKLFSSKHINVANRRRIKGFNFGIVLVFFTVCIVVVNFNRIIDFMGDVFNGMTKAAGTVIEKIAFWLLKDSEAERIIEESEKKLPRMRFAGGQSTVLELIIIIILIALLIAVVSISIILIKRHKLTISKVPHGNLDEFDDDSEIIIEKLHLKLGRRFHYSIRNLEKIEDIGERTRYLYGFIIERLYYKKVDILKSDTPDDILKKAFECDDGNLLESLGFEELTENYRKVRYGGKQTYFAGDMCEVAKEYERVILSYYNEAEENS